MTRSPLLRGVRSLRCTTAASLLSRRGYIAIEDILLNEDMDDYKQISLKVGELPEAKFIKGRFICPWSYKIKMKSGRPLNFFNWAFFRKQTELNFPSHMLPGSSLDEVLEKVPVDMEALECTKRLSMTWLGHSSCLVQSGGLHFLTDPVFSMRTSPVPFYGPKRIQSPLFNIAQLRKLDVVLLSHTHYDHLDYDSAVRIRDNCGPHVKWIVPLGVSKILARWGITNVVELNWWEKYNIVDERRKIDVEVVFTPAKHWTGRSIFDRNKCLWGSFVVSSAQGRFYFGGDSSYCTVFKMIGDLYGPFDLAALAIGAYKPRWFMKHVHADPSEAVQIHKDLRSKQSVGIHWGTFPLADEADIEPALDLAKHRELQSLTSRDIFTMGLGETFLPGDDAPTTDIATRRPDLFQHYRDHYVEDQVER